MVDKQTLYLSRAACSLPPSGNLDQLKSHLLWVSCTLRGKDVAKSSMMCPNCCQLWSLGKFSLRTKSNAPTSPRFVKILRKSINSPNKLNRVESSLLKRYKQTTGNNLVIICNICNHKTVMPMKKQVREIKQLTEAPVIIECESAKKKKKRKDRFAGLNVSAVISASPSPHLSSLKSASKVDKLQMTPGSTTPGRVLKTTPPNVSSHGRTSITPKSSRLQSETSLKKSGPRSIKQQMKLLREEVKQAEQNRVKEEIKALSIRNLNVKKNNKLQDFLSKREKDVHLEDRINSLLQL